MLKGNKWKNGKQKSQKLIRLRKKKLKSRKKSMKSIEISQNKSKNKETSSLIK